MRFFKVIFFLCLFTINYCIIKRPQIKYENQYLEEDATIQKRSNENLELSCTADYPVKWVLPDNKNYQNYTNPVDDGRFGTCNIVKRHVIMVVNDLKWTDTGFYRCTAVTYEVLPTTDMGKAENRVYIFVKDSEKNHLFLHPYDNTSEFKLLSKNYVKCLVTDETATVELFYNFRKVNNPEYDNRFGFKIRGTDIYDKNEGLLTCNASVIERSIEDELDFVPRSFKPPVSNFVVTMKPENLEDLLYIDNDVTIICDSNSERKYCSLTYPKDPFPLSQSGPVSLRIKQVDYNYGGVYKCQCLDLVYYPELKNHTGLVEGNYIVRATKGKIIFIAGNIGSTEGIENENRTLYVKLKLFLPKEYSSADVTIEWHRQYSTVMHTEKLFEEIHYDNKTFKRTDSQFDQNHLLTFELNPDITTGLIILNTSANLSGDYILTIHALDHVVYYFFYLTIRSRPKVLPILVTQTVSSYYIQLNSNFLEKGKKYDIWCIVEGYPLEIPSIWFRASVNGSHKPCDDCSQLFDDDHPADINVNRNLMPRRHYQGTYQSALVAEVVALETGTYKCTLQSMPTLPSSAISYIVTDIRNAQENEGFYVESEIEPSLPGIFEYAQVKLICKTQKYIYEMCEWYFQPLTGSISRMIQTNSGDYDIRLSNGTFSNKLVLTIHSIQLEQAGNYKCRCNATDGTFIQKGIEISVLKTERPWIGNGSSSSEESFHYEQPAKIICDAHGGPLLQIQWDKNGIPFNETFNRRISFGKNRKEFNISTVYKDDEGTYSCIVSNFAGQTVSSKFHRRVIGIMQPPINVVLAIASAALGLSVFGLIIVVLSQRLKHARKLKLLSEIHRELFEPSNNMIAIDLPLHEQTDYLKYSKQFDVSPSFLLPFESPKLLGKGEYGKVIKSILKFPYQANLERYTVAVKTIKNNLAVDQIKSLLNEIKIMIHIGFHVNVLPLIGAVTSRLPINELYVITEYCALGSLLNFIKNRRFSFINELKAANEECPQENGNFNECYDGYITHNIQSISYHKYHELSRNVKRDTNELCTSDLLFIAYQIANGMEFLSSKNVIHRDLAARNILINENNIIRISDFGLSRHGKMYQIEKNKFKLPYKWLALESLLDWMFSEKSDVWSFGIVLWEIFSLGQSPYQDFGNCADLIAALKNGYRLHKPEMASEQIYLLMRGCWLTKPKNRPSYAECKSMISMELNRVCPECHNNLQSVLNHPKNQPDYSGLRAKFTNVPLHNKNAVSPNNIKNETIL